MDDHSARVAPRTGYAMLTACLVGGSSGWSLTAAGAGASSLTVAYGVGLLGIGLMTTALAAAYAVLQLPAGVLVDSIGVRRAAMLGLGVVVLAYLVACVTPATGLALACRVAAGAGCAVCFVSGAEIARRSGAGPAGLGLFGGFALASCGFALVGVPLGELALGWRSAWLTSGCVALAALVAVARLPETLGSGERPRPPRPRAGGQALLRDAEVHRLAAVHAVTLGLGIVLSNWATVVLESDWGFSHRSAAVTGSLILGLTVLSRPLGGHLTRHRPAQDGLVTAAVLVACAAATAALAVPTIPLVAVLAVVTLGLTSGLPFAAVISAGQARHPDRPAAAVGLMNTQANGLIFLVTPVLGAAIEAAATTPALLVVAAVWLLPLISRPTLSRTGER